MRFPLRRCGTIYFGGTDNLIRASALKTNCPLRDWFTYKGFEPREGEGKRARMETGNIFEPLVLNRFLKENPHIIMERPPENARRLMIAEVNGLLVDPSNENELAKAILRVLNNDDLRAQAIVENQRIIAARAEYEHSMAQAEKFYREII